MPQCKKDGCREPALPTGKRYCVSHMAEYLRKQKEYAAVSATLRCCASCGTKLTKTGHDRGDLYCASCVQRYEARQVEIEKSSSFETVETVDDLKQWIRRYMLWPNKKFTSRWSVWWAL